ncbi:DUF3592 domain-containing protein [Aureispira anguillae]|uniref:DUF3592 domain-containing protein n=1 Tax=Aureispira anguillae TaxID=2864201 RepID=A0A915YE01_9BACT|nr:DUF3592 domain-containing protein [Aureispira anguillae]BDS11266.1 DUF3592 domain-containing protein [Aureispira anguillae]
MQGIGNTVRECLFNWKQHKLEIALLLIGLFLMITGAQHYVTTQRFLSNGVKTVATVVDFVKESTAYNDGDCHLMLSYDAYRTTVVAAYDSYCVMGKKIEVVYNPNAPQEVTINDTSALFIGGMLLLIGFLCVFMMVVVYRSKDNMIKKEA